MFTKPNSSFDLHAPECYTSAPAHAEATRAHTNAHAEATRAHTNAHAEATSAPVRTPAPAPANALAPDAPAQVPDVPAQGCDVCASVGACANANSPAEATGTANALARAATQARSRTKARMSTRDIATIAMLAALAIVASFVCDIPLIPGATFLTYDPSGAIIMAGAFTYGPAPGVIIAFVTCILHGSSSGIIGVAVNLIVSCTLALGAGWFGRLFTHIPGMSISKRVPILCAYLVTSAIFVAVALATNLLLTPLYTGLPLSSVVAMIVPILLPFNLIKAALNIALAYLFTIALMRILPAANGRRKAVAPVAKATAVSAEATSEGAAPAARAQVTPVAEATVEDATTTTNAQVTPAAVSHEGAAPAAQESATPTPTRPESEASVNG